jgi:integrase/recombinase XerD
MQTVYKDVAANRIPYVRYRGVRFDPVYIAQWLRARTVRQILLCCLKRLMHSQPLYASLRSRSTSSVGGINPTIARRFGHPMAGTPLTPTLCPYSMKASTVAAIEAFLDETELTKKPKTLAAYRTALNYFTESCPKLYLEDLERGDLLKFSAFLRDEKELHPRTVYNKFENVMSFLKSQGIRGLVSKNDWPRFVEEEPEVYEREDLDKLFATCDQQEKLWFEFFLMTGMREQEVMHCSWDDINLTRGTVTVRYKPEYGFSPKNYREREIPIPVRLVKELQAFKMKSDKTCGLVFPTSGCYPKQNFLDDLKACAERAKLKKADFWLHKFRATFATWSLWAGVDLRTVQQWLGHSDMGSTMRYLKPSRSQQVGEKVNEICH